MNLDLSGKKAVVCGSSQGLGLASAKELALLGAEITLLSRNGQRLQDAVHTLNASQGQNHDYLVADFFHPEEVKEAIEKRVAEKDVDILVNNTGGPKGGNILDASPEEFLAGFQSHLICNHILVKAVLPSMKKNNWGRIINIISTSVKQPIPGLGVSNTIRAAVANWAKTLANEAGPFGITVNNVLPGYTRTARLESIIESRAKEEGISEKEIENQMASSIPLRRIGRPEDFGAAVAFLCSPAANYISGINLPVDGGRLSCL